MEWPVGFHVLSFVMLIKAFSLCLGLSICKLSLSVCLLVYICFAVCFLCSFPISCSLSFIYSSCVFFSTVFSFRPFILFFSVFDLFVSSLPFLLFSSSSLSLSILGLRNTAHNQFSSELQTTTRMHYVDIHISNQNTNKIYNSASTSNTFYSSFNPP